MRKLLKSLACFATAALVGASAFANYDWYDTSIGIGGIKSNFQDWSRGNGDPDTDLGALTSLTLSSVEMNIWDDANDRGGVNMFFRLYGADGQIGGDVDVWLGGAERIEGSVHDFSVSYTGPFDLANAFGVTLEDGKTYYLNMWAKSYGDAGDHWYNGDGDNYHTKFVYCATPKTYTLVESADDLVVGADYLVVSTVDGAYSAMKNEVNGTGIACLGLADDAISGNTISAASDAIVWQIVSGTALGQRELYNAAANVFAADSDDLAGRAQLLADGTDALAQWTIDTSALPDVKFYSVSYPDRCLQRDNYAANERFAAYDRAHVAPCLYRDDSTVQTVTFDVNDGDAGAYCPVTTLVCLVGGLYEGFEPAVWENHIFRGWWTDPTDGTRVMTNETVSADSTLTLYAHWQACQTVTFDANGDGAVVSKDSKMCPHGGNYSGFASATWDGHRFLGWYDDPTGGSRVLSGTAVTDSDTRTLYAHWDDVQTVYFDGNGDGAVVSKPSTQCSTSGNYSGFASATWDGHIFRGWYDDPTDGQRIKGGMPVTGGASLTLYAHWDAVQTVYFDANGDGAVASKPSTQCLSGGNYSGFASATWEGHVFKGWFDDPTDGERVKGGMPVTEDASRTLYAHWKESASAASATITGFSFASKAANGKRDASPILSEDFSGFTGTSADRSSSLDNYLAGTGWTGSKVFENAGSAKLGSSSANGWIATPALDIPAGAVLSCLITKYGSDTGTVAINISTDGGSTYSPLVASITPVSGGETTTYTFTQAYTGAKIQIISSSKRVYLDDIVVTAGSSSAQSVTLTLDPDTTEVEVGDELTITGAADGFSSENVTWSWTVDDEPDATTGDTFTVDTSAAVEETTITATASYGTETASASVTITVTAPKHTIAIDSAIVNGSITTTPSGEAAEGALVTVIPSPASGYQLGFITVNGDDLAAGVTTFTMPTENVTVSATFVAYVAPDLYFQFESDDLPGSYTAGNVNFANTGSTAADVPTVAFTLQRGIAGDLANDKKVGNVALRLAPTSGDGFARNATAFSTPITKVAFQYAKYGTDSCTSFKVQVSSDGENWQDLADLTSTVTDTLQTYTSTSVPEGSTFIRFIATNSGSSNNRRLNVDEIQLWLAAPVTTPTVTLSPSEAEVLVGGTLTLIATAENFSGPVTWEWTADSGVADGATFAVDTTRAGEFLIIAEATCGEEYDYAEATITVKNPPTAHAIEVDYGDGSEGTASASPVSAFEGDTVTLTVTPATGYAVDSITASEYTSLDPIAVDPDSLTFVMPDDDVYVEVTFKEVVEYMQITSMNAMQDGEFVITGAGTGGQFAMKNITSGSTVVINRRDTAVTIVDGAVTDAEASILWTLAKNDDGYWTISNSAAGYVGYLDSGNSARFASEVSEATLWTIEESGDDDGLFLLTNVGDSDRMLLYNASSPRFACYASIGNQKLLSLYRKKVPRQRIDFNVNGEGASCDVGWLELDIGSTYTNFVPATWDNHIFRGWWTDPTDGTRVQMGGEVTSDSTLQLYAHWQSCQTVYFQANGEGAIVSKESKMCPHGGNYSGFASATWDGHRFLGWYDDPTAGTRVSSGTAVTEADSRTLYAHWEEVQTVYFNANGDGAVASKESTQCAIGGNYSGFASATWEGHIFRGWYDDPTDGERVKGGMAVTGGSSRTLYAHWDAAQTVYFNANGDGAVASKASTQCLVGGNYSGFASATWEGHVFKGWYDDPTDGERVKSGMAVTEAASRTLYAHWKESASASQASITAYSFASRATGPVARSADSATVECTLWVVTKANHVYEIQWTDSLESEWTVLKHWVADADAEEPVTVVAPASASGFFLLVEIAD